MIGSDMARLLETESAAWASGGAEPLDVALAEWRSGRPLASLAQAAPRGQDREAAELVAVAEALWLGAGNPRPEFTLELERMVRLGSGSRPLAAVDARRTARRPLLSRTRLAEAMAACGLAAAMAVAAVLVTGPSGSPGAVPTARAATGTATPTALVAAETPASDPG